MARSTYIECSICQQALTDTTGDTNQHIESEHDAIRSNGDHVSQIPWSPPVALSCGHIYHKNCIKQWFDIKKRSEGRGATCPTCRTPVSGRRLLRVYLSIGTPSPPSTEVRERYPRQMIFNFQRRRQEERDRSHGRRIYNDYFLMCYGTRSQYEIGSDDGHNNAVAEPLLCEKADCFAVRNVYQMLSKEFKMLQRRLEMEMEVSRMKSVLVSSMQADINTLQGKLRNMPRHLGGYIVFVLLPVLCLLFIFVKASVPLELE